jgi:hypothetical protein
VNDILTDLIASWRGDLGPDADPGELTDRLLDTVLKMQPVTARELLRPVILPWVRKAEADRNKVLKSEQRVFGYGAARHGNVAQEAMRALLVGTCYVEGHGLVPWGAMTVLHHGIRVAFLERTRDAYVAGVNATITRHGRAGQLLTDSGFTDLNAYVAEFGELPDDLMDEEASPNATTPGG